MGGLKKLQAGHVFRKFRVLGQDRVDRKNIEFEQKNPEQTKKTVPRHFFS
jgi:hypothetical protein